jgi:hypothetical protein
MSDVELDGCSDSGTVWSRNTVWSRQQFVRRAASALGLMLAGGLTGSRFLELDDAVAGELAIRPAETAGAGMRVFRSRPDLRPPLVTVLRRTSRTADGYLFLAPNSGPGQRGVMIVDDAGELVWFRRTFPQTAMNFRTALYKGEPVLTWWEGKTDRGLGTGEHVILDSSYQEVVRFPAGRGRESDLHELILTPRGTALVSSWEARTMDLRYLGGTSRHQVIGGVVQEIEIPSARVLFEWRSLDHVPISESQQGVGPSFDYFHINSIDVDADGNFLISARNTWALYKVSRRTGKVLWRLGGKKSDFAMGPGTSFAWQHDARHLGPDDRLITLFDNGAAPPVEGHSHAMILQVDHARKRVTLGRDYSHDSRKLLAFAMGNAQRLGNGNLLVGWGTEPYLTEFSMGGDVVFDARLPHGGQNYRAFRLPWVGLPRDRPKLVARSTSAGRRLYASWNGATEVAAWRLLAGNVAAEMGVKATGTKRAFETMLTAPSGARFAAVAALDRHDKVLAMSNVVRL